MAVNGIGWISSNGFGTILSGRSVTYGEGETLRTVDRETLFQQPVRNFGRLDGVSRITLAAVSLALGDGGITSSPERKQAIGIVGSNSDGSLATDIDYFRDYVENGRKLSRANLFIYTLPSSPLGEAAIHFGLTGPLLYITDSNESALAAVNMAADLILDGGAPMMLAGRTAGETAIYLLLGSPSGRSLCTVDEAAAILSGGFDVPVMAGRFSSLRKG